MKKFLLTSILICSTFLTCISYAKDEISYTSKGELSISFDNESPQTNEYIGLTISADDKDYTGKVVFTAKYSNTEDGSGSYVKLNSKTYFKNYSDIWESNYYKMKTSDKGEKTFDELFQFAKGGYYTITIQDTNGNKATAKIHVTKGDNNEEDEDIDEDEDTDNESYTSRSGKKYTISYDEDLEVYTSEDLNIEEFFINKEYLKRYIDSKNKQISGYPTNKGRISSSYLDKSDDEDKFIAPNGKVYFIEEKNGYYTSDQLSTKSSTKKFSSLSLLKYFIRDNNPLIGM